VTITTKMILASPSQGFMPKKNCEMNFHKAEKLFDTQSGPDTFQPTFLGIPG
jgi:hypothetical protein